MAFRIVLDEYRCNEFNARTVVVAYYLGRMTPEIMTPELKQVLTLAVRYLPF